MAASEAADVQGRSLRLDVPAHLLVLFAPDLAAGVALIQVLPCRATARDVA